MKLVYLSNAAIPSRSANSIHIMKMSQAFAGLGNSVHLIATDRTDPGVESVDPFLFYSVGRVFKLHTVRWLSSMPGKYFIYAFLSAWKALTLGADLVYGRYLFGVYTAERLGKTVVFESHSDEFTRSGLHRRMIQRLTDSPRCKKIVVISHALKEAYMAEFPGIERKIIVAHDGADPKPNLKNNNTETNFTVGYVGHFYKGKGMEVISELIPQNPDIRFLLVGGTEYDLLYWKDKLHNSGHVKFIGFVPHSETDSYLSEMDIVLAPYLSKVLAGSTGGIEIGRWMSPLKIFEYMSAGKPIIASDLPVIREILQHQKNAILCNPDDPAEWTEAINLLKNNDSLRNRLAVQAKKDFEEKYSWKKRAENLLSQIYE